MQVSALAAATAAVLATTMGCIAADARAADIEAELSLAAISVFAMGTETNITRVATRRTAARDMLVR